MSAVSESIVREYFETLGFLVQQPMKYTVTARAKQPTEEVDFLAVNLLVPESPAVPDPSGMVVSSVQIKTLSKVMVSLRGWHTDRITPAKLELAPEIYRFADALAVRDAKHRLGAGVIRTVLCLPGLPSTPGLASRTLDLLREKGVDYVVLFPSMLRELIRQMEVSKNYEKSDLLQTLRILKSYDLLKNEQLELFHSKPVRKVRAKGTGET